MACEICGKSDLFSEVTGEPTCSICVVKLGANKHNVRQIREAIGIKDGEFLKQDNAAEARKILGR